MEKINKRTKRPRKPQMSVKMRGFVKDYVKTGDARDAVIKNYNLNPETNKSVKLSASVIASNLMDKPQIQKAIARLADRIPDERIIKKHLQLLEAHTMERLPFDEFTSDETIKDTIERMEGFELLHITDKIGIDGSVIGRLAYVKAPDNVTQDKALDKAYKIKGTYSSQKVEITGKIGLGSLEQLSNEELESLVSQPIDVSYESTNTSESSETGNS